MNFLLVQFQDHNSKPHLCVDKMVFHEAGCVFAERIGMVITQMGSQSFFGLE